MKSLKNNYVVHKRFGRGMIIGEDTGKVTVEFDSQTENKIFQFPDAFEQFLKFEDKSLQEESLILVQAKKQQKIERNARKRLELEKQEAGRKEEELKEKKKKAKTMKDKKPKVIKQLRAYDIEMKNEVATMIREDKERALREAINRIEKDFGKGAVMRLGDTNSGLSVETVPTGALSLDIALGLGGIPRGRVIEVFGPESSGKTTVSLHMIAEVQKRGGIAAFIDAEHALDPVYAKNVGVNIDELYISQPDSGDQGLEIAETLVRSGAIDIIVIDSVAALVPRQEIEGDMGDAHMGLQARLMSQALRKLTPVVGKSNCIVVFINQLREKIGIMFGNPETTTGGRALKFYASVRLDIRRIESLKQGGEVIGNRTRIKVVKNKIATPFKEAVFDIMFGKGISREGDILDLAAEINVVNKSGAWYAYNGEKIGQGRENTKVYFTAHREVMEEIEMKIREYYHLNEKIEEESEQIKDLEVTKAFKSEKASKVDCNI